EGTPATAATSRCSGAATRARAVRQLFRPHPAVAKTMEAAQLSLDFNVVHCAKPLTPQHPLNADAASLSPYRGRGDNCSDMPVVMSPRPRKRERVRRVRVQRTRRG